MRPKRTVSVGLFRHLVGNAKVCKSEWHIVEDIAGQRMNLKLLSPGFSRLLTGCSRKSLGRSPIYKLKRSYRNLQADLQTHCDSVDAWQLVALRL